MRKQYFQQRYAPKIQKPLYLILIATEGSRTEQQYFPKVANCNAQNVVVEMIDDGTTNSDPLHVLNRMKSRIQEHHFQKDDNWEAWIVIDNEWNQDQLMKLVEWRKEDFLHHHVTVVSPKFEEWLKYHVQGDNDARRKFADLLSHRHGCQNLPEGFVNKTRVLRAIQLASSKQNRQRKEIEQIYVLVKRILNVKI